MSHADSRYHRAEPRGFRVPLRGAGPPAGRRPSWWPGRPGAGPPTGPGPPGTALVRHYLDPTRRPLRGRALSVRHREEQEAYCRRSVAPVIAEVELRQLSRSHFARVLGALTPSVASQLRRCLTAMVAAGLEEAAAGHPGRAAGGALARLRRPIEGESSRRRQKPGLATLDPPPPAPAIIPSPTLNGCSTGPMPLAKTWSHAAGERQAASRSADSERLAGISRSWAADASR